MKNSVSSFSMVLMAILIFGYYVSAQDTEKQTNNKPDFASFDKPLIYATENDNLPKEIRAKGIIVDASPAGFYCGVFATAGTLKIKLSEKIENYNEDYLYVVILCFAVEEREKLLNKEIEITAKKMTKFPYKFGVLLSNSIDSKGTPFYLSTVDGVGGLLKKLDNESEK